MASEAEALRPTLFGLLLPAVATLANAGSVRRARLNCASGKLCVADRVTSSVSAWNRSRALASPSTAASRSRLLGGWFARVCLERSVPAVERDELFDVGAEVH